MTDDGLKGKVALVTGAGSGLGEATARAFARAGCAVACVDVNGHAVGCVSRELSSGGGESVALVCDVGDAEAVFGSVVTVVRRYGRLDMGVNSTAIANTPAVHT